MHRVTEESGLPESADGSIARRAFEAVGLDRDVAATSALTKCAFSWKFTFGKPAYSRLRIFMHHHNM
jgi:hypothetical protein